MDAPLYNELIAYSHSKLVFHMPGHKFGSIADLNKLNLPCLDNTETMGMDNLYEANGIIKQAMILMADFYGARDTVFLTNGSTSGILASILSICNEGDELIVARNAHHSVWSGMILAGVKPIYISPEYHEEEDILGEIKPERVEEALRRYPNAKGVLVVSPTYEGIVSNIKVIADIVHKHDKILIVDEAHGAHFVLGNDFPISAIRQGADIVINSMHKTLPALTQSALLHICSNKIKYEDVVSNLRMIQTSSPSYMMMGLMDYIRCYILEYHNLIKRQYIDVLINTRTRLRSSLQVLKLIEQDKRTYDISKVVISTAYSNINGYQLANVLNKEFNIAVEAALETYVILMTTMADQSETLGRLEKALNLIDRQLQRVKRRESINAFMVNKITIGKGPREIHYGNKKWMPIRAALDSIAVNNIMLYPPGIPIICVGEKVEMKQVEIIERFKDRVQGIKFENNELMIQVSV